jgi:histidine decarboxylase
MDYDGKNYPGTKPSTQFHYPPVEGIDTDDLILTSDGLTEEQRARALKQVLAYESRQKANFLGYQANQQIDFKTDLSEYLSYHVNNIGDPFESGNFTVNSKFVERAVLDYFASLWHARWPYEKDDKLSAYWRESYWGYVLSMGSSEGNLYGLWNARDYLQGKTLVVDDAARDRKTKASEDGMKLPATPRYKVLKPKAPGNNGNAYTPICFYSLDTHYSIIKNMRILEIATFFEEANNKGYACPLNYPDDYPSNYSREYIAHNNWPTEVPADDNGILFIPALTKLVQFFAEKGYPILLSLNFGTTFKGAYDNVEKIISAVVPVLKNNGLYERQVEYAPGKSDIRNGFWIHVDGALGAAYAPFLKKHGIDIPNFDFSLPEVHSITMSGHKWIGAPWPCGVFMSKKKYQLQPVDNPAYIGSSDTTFSGSRNGLSALILWDFIAKNSVENLVNRILADLNRANQFVESLKKLQARIGTDIWIEHSPGSLTVRFKQANPDIVFKYSLSGEDLYVNGQVRSYSHVYMMPAATDEMLNRLLDDLGKPGAFSEQKPNQDIVTGRGLGFK